MTIRMTKDEKRAYSIAKGLVKAIQRIEEFDCDPEIIFDDANIVALNMSQAVRDTLAVIKDYYCS